MKYGTLSCVFAVRAWSGKLFLLLKFYHMIWENGGICRGLMEVDSFLEVGVTARTFSGRVGG